MNTFVKNSINERAKKLSQLIIVTMISIVGLTGCATALIAGAAITTVDIIHADVV